MIYEIESIGKEKMPSVLNNPFLRDRIKSIRVNFIQNVFDENDWSAYGSVEFKNGNTSGEQKFKGATFDEVVLQIKSFFNELETNTNK